MPDEKRVNEPILVRLIEEPTSWLKRVPVLALAISILALAVSSLGAYWSLRNYRLSVAPLITAWHAPDPAKPQIHWRVTNAGLGPAVIKDVALFVNGQRGKGSIAADLHWTALRASAAAPPEINWDQLLVPGEGFRAGAEIEPFTLAFTDVASMEQAQVDSLAVLAICYCSFYEQCRYADSRVYSDTPSDPLIKECAR